MIQTAFLLLAAMATATAEPTAEHASSQPSAPVAAAPAQPMPPEGMTKNMIYLEFVTVTGTFKDWFGGQWTILTDGHSQYCVSGVPRGEYAVGEAIAKVILVKGRILEILENRRRYQWFSAGVITPELIKAYRKENDYDVPLD